MAPHPLQYDDPAIVAPVDDGSLMAAAAGYVFWPFFAPFTLVRTPRTETYVRFHCGQAVALGLLSSVAFALFTLVLWAIYRGVGAPESLMLGAFLMALFGAWLVALLFCFCLFLGFAWRAGRGDVFRVPIIGPMVERWVLTTANADV